LFGERYKGRFIFAANVPYELTLVIRPFEIVEYNIDYPVSRRVYWNNYPIDKKPQVIIGNLVTSQLCFADNANIDYEISIDYNNTDIVPRDLKVTVENDFSNSQEYFFTLPASTTGNILQVGNIDVKNGNKIFVELESLGSVAPGLFINPTSYLEITGAKINEAFDIRVKEQALGDGGYRYLTPSTMLPDIKQSDFLKDYLLLNSGIVSLNELSKTAYLNPFENIKNNLSVAIDWSGKLDFIKNNTVEFTLGDYAQRNLFTYNEDASVVKPDGTDGELLIDDENIEFEKDFVSLKFAATESVERFGGLPTNQIKVLTSADFEESVNNRILVLDYTNRSFLIYNSTDVNSGSSASISQNVPFTHFIKEGEDYNLGFADNRIPQSYSFLEGILNRTKVIECLLRLNTSDIATFDFLKPVYIKELDGYFYVSKIKFDYTSNASSVCELVKLL
jgi:hypothetical protein